MLFCSQDKPINTTNTEAALRLPSESDRWRRLKTTDGVSQRQGVIDHDCIRGDLIVCQPHLVMQLGFQGFSC